jgi:hypothetical protein
MSLTRFIKDFQELRDRFKIGFPKPDFPFNNSILAPPLTQNYAIIGGAFDYLLRFWMEFHHGKKVVKKEEWLAEAVYRQLLRRMLLLPSKMVSVGYRGVASTDRVKFIDTIEKEFANAKNSYYAFIKTGVIEENIIRAVLFLARLDVCYRSGMIDANIGNESKDDIKDLNALMKLVNKRNFKVKEYCFLNPTFGEGSGLVGGADADLIIDDTLIEIKVCKDLKLDRKYLDQVLGYYILSLIGGVDGLIQTVPIKNVAIYFARHGVLWKIPINAMASEKAVLGFKDFFIELANREIRVRDKVADMRKKALTDMAAVSNEKDKKKMVKVSIGSKLVTKKVVKRKLSKSVAAKRKKK